MKFIYIKRSNGSIVDVPERDVEATLKRNKDWTIWNEPKEEDRIKQIQCPICMKPFKNQGGLNLHKKVHG